MDNCYICGCVRNTGKYLDKIFENIKILEKCFNSCYIIISLDKSDDNSYEILQSYEKKYNKKMLNKNTISSIIKIDQDQDNKGFSLLYNPDKVLGKYRTERISIARNEILDEIIRLDKKDYKYMIMMDFDDVNGTYRINSDILNKYLIRSDWDALSFNRRSYYDTWALSIDNYVYSKDHFNTSACGQIKNYIENKLNNLDLDKLLTCYSAFNGLAIYRLEKFKNCKYEWNINTTCSLIEEILGNNALAIHEKTINGKFDINKILEDCEHRYFHLLAIKLNNAKIRISPFDIYDFFEASKITLSNNIEQFMNIEGNPNLIIWKVVIIIVIILGIISLLFIKKNLN